jgi:hypothetical protein
MALRHVPTTSWLDDLEVGGEMVERIRRLDWASTGLGHPDTWSLALTTAVRICLTSRFPMLVLWGPDMIKIYNDGYRPLLGADKHPGALGSPVRDVWSEIWHEIGPLLDGVVDTGEPSWTEHGRLLVERNGFLEEGFFTWSYSCLYDDDGSVGGVLDVVSETTDQIRAERRLASLTATGRELIGASALVEVCLGATRALDRWSDDVRAADIYLHAGDDLVLVATNRRWEAAPVSSRVIQEVARTGRPEVLGQRLGASGPVEHVVVPLDPGAAGPRGVMVVSLDSHVPFDRGLSQFVDATASSINAALERAYRHEYEIGELRSVSDTLQQAMVTPLSDTATIAARYVAATGGLSVGGDWYDLVDLSDTQRALVVGDCVGHGLAAATAMSQLRSAAQAMLLDGRDPASMLEGLDRFAATVNGASYATVACLIVDRSEGSLTYSRAGHPPPVLVGPSRAAWLDGAGGPPLTLAAEGTRTNATVQMHVEDVLVLYTDGLIERRRQGLDERFQLLLEEVQRVVDAPVAMIADHLLRELAPEGASDDMVVVVKRLPQPG